MTKLWKLQPQRKSWRFLFPGNKNTKPRSSRRRKPNVPEIPRPRFIYGGPTVWYDGDPTRYRPCFLNSIKKHAEFAIQVYNKTRLNKYSLVELLHVHSRHRDGLLLHMIFTAKPDPEEDNYYNNPITFRAGINFNRNYLLYFYSHRGSREEERETSVPPDGDSISVVLFDRDPNTRCNWDNETKNMINECLDFALDAYNKTHRDKLVLMYLVRATGVRCAAGNLSTVDLIFNVKPYMNPETYHARVSMTHNYVEFVKFVGPARALL
ncbi:hypothetical protein ABFS83_06G082000 [Erythranthe nasuta]